MIKLSEILKDTNDAAGIAYSYKGYLLCVRDNKGLWGIPKGHIQQGESPEQGAMREFTEETQIMLNRPIKFSHTSPKKKGKFHIYYCMGDKRVNPHIGHEHTEAGYYPMSDLPQPFDERVVDVVDNIMNENIKIPVKVGDTILTGRFKNKKVKIKSIGKDEHGMPTINGKKVVTFRIPKLKELLNLKERVDFLDTANQIVKQQGLKSKVMFGKGPNKADYDWKKDIIYLRRSYPSFKDFLITVYHEIDHAKDRKKYGARAYEKKYQRAGDIAVNQGKDFHDDNYYEEKAERYGRKMAKLHLAKKL